MIGEVPPRGDAPKSDWRPSDDATLCQAMLKAAFLRARQVGLTVDEAQDCAQEFVCRRFVVLRRSFLPIPRVHNPSGYLQVCAYNAVWDYCRVLAERKRHEEALLPGGEESRDLYPDPALPLEEQLMRGEFRNAARRQISALSPALNEYARLYFLEELTAEEVAQRCGRSLTATQRALTRCRSVLRERLTALGWAPQHLL